MEKHPQLAEKFQLLYVLQLNPEIQTHTNLAKQLGRSKQAITKWCRGSATTRGNAIPLDQVANVAKIFKVEPQWFSLPYDEFEKIVRQRVSELNADSDSKKVRISTGTLPITDLNLFGRDSELKQLDDLWEDPTVNVVEIVAFGGSGKSALVNKWLSEMNKSNYKDAENVYAWSFYWQSESEDIKSAGDYFIEHALEWFGDPNPSKGTPWSKANRLAFLVRSRKTVLILDGLEPLQYPAGEKVGLIGDHALSLLIKELASDNSGLCILTTRYKVADLAAQYDGRVRSIDLAQLDNAASVSLLKNCGVEGNPREIDRIVSKYAGHPLSLTLLGGFLSTVHNGDIRQLSKMDSVVGIGRIKSNVQDLMRGYISWLSQGPEIQILRLLCLIEKATSIEELIALGRNDKIRDLTDLLNDLSEVKWRYALKNLEAAKIVSIDFESNPVSLDCHPLIKDFINENTRKSYKSAWRSGNKMVFKDLLGRLPDYPESLQEFDPFFRAVLHGTRAGEIEEAFNFYYLRIKRKQFSMQPEGSHYADQACIRSFFDREWDLPAQALSEDAQNYLLTSAATNLIYLGNIRDAILPCKKSIEWFKERGEWLQAAVASGPLASMYIAAGELVEAMKLIAEMEDSVAKTGNDIAKAMYSSFKGYVLFLNGKAAEAEQLFQESDQVLSSPIPSSEVIFPTISSYYCKFLLEIGKVHEALERSLRTLAWRMKGSWQVAIDTTSIVASDYLVLGLVFLEIGDIANAKIYLEKQVNLFQSSAEWLYLPTGLNSRARLHAAVSDLNSAHRDLDESLAISKRTGARFGEWEAHIDKAQLYAHQNKTQQARECLSTARNLPGMDHYKFRNKEISELEHKLGLH